MKPADRIRRWLRGTMEQQGVTAEQWAARAGVAKSTIFRALNPNYEFVTSSRTLSKLAEALGVPPPIVANEITVAPRFLPVRYKVQAGLWYEIDAEEPVEQVALAVLPDPRFEQFPQWLEKVVGDSVNRKIPDGQYAHVVDAVELGYAPQDGDWVVVERVRDGHVRERTIKQVEIREGQVFLCPRSTNPKWSDPVELTAGAAHEESVEVRIVGKVIGAYNPDF